MVLVINLNVRKSNKNSVNLLGGSFKSEFRKGGRRGPEGMAGSDWENLFIECQNRPGLFQRISDLSNFPAITGFLVMALKRTRRLSKCPIKRAESV